MFLKLLEEKRTQQRKKGHEESDVELQEISNEESKDEKEDHDSNEKSRQSEEASNYVLII